MVRYAVHVLLIPLRLELTENSSFIPRTHAEIDRLHECMSDSADLSGQSGVAGVPRLQNGTVQPLSPPDC